MNIGQRSWAPLFSRALSCASLLSRSVKRPKRALLKSRVVSLLYALLTALMISNFTICVAATRTHWHKVPDLKSKVLCRNSSSSSLAESNVPSSTSRNHSLFFFYLLFFISPSCCCSSQYRGIFIHKTANQLKAQF